METPGKRKSISTPPGATRARATRRRGPRSCLDPQRLAVVEQALTSGIPRRAYEAKLGAEWHVNARQVREYATAVREEWRRQRELESVLQREDVRARLELVYGKAMTAGEFRAAITALERLAAFDGLNIVQVAVNHGGKVGVEVAGAVEVVTDPAAAKDRALALLEAHPELVREFLARHPEFA